MRIAIVSPSITTDFVSESYYNVQAFGLSRELAKCGHSVRIFTIGKRPSVRQMPVENGTGDISIEYVRATLNIPRRQLMSPTVLGELRKGGFDVVQVSEDNSITSLMVGLRKQGIGSKLVVYQGLYGVPRNMFAKTYSRIYDTLPLRIMRGNVDCVIAKTSSAESYMRSRGYRQVVTIPVGVDAGVFRPLDKADCRARLGIDANDRVILYVGRILPHRDLETCILALKKAARCIDNLRLLLVGDGNHLPSILSLASSLGVADRIRVLGNVRNDDLPAVYSAADLTVLPMKRTSVFIFGMVIPESFGCGTPVISAPVPAAIDHIVEGQTGYVFPFENPDVMAEAILKSISQDENRRRMSMSARRYCCEHLDWSALVPRFLSAYS